MTPLRTSHLLIVLIVLLVFVCLFVKCDHEEPTNTNGPVLPNGRWAGDGACLSVTDSGCNFVAGCGHGQFPKPVIRPDGTFDVDGTFRIEVGPVSIDPPPPAHFSGSISGSVLILHVVPAKTPPPETYSLTPTSDGTCTVPCV